MENSEGHLLPNLIEGVDDDADKELEGKEGAEEHPGDAEERVWREVIPERRVAGLGHRHHHVHRRLPLVTRRHDVQQPHGGAEVIEGAYGRVEPLGGATISADLQVRVRVPATALEPSTHRLEVGCRAGDRAADCAAEARIDRGEGRVGARAKLAGEELHAEDGEDELEGTDDLIRVRVRVRVGF